MRFAKKLEDRIAQRARAIAQNLAGEWGPAEILELQAAVLDDIAEHIQTLPNSRAGFPFGKVVVRFPAYGAPEIASLRQAFCDDSILEKAIRAHLAKRRCTVPPGLGIEVSVIEAAGTDQPPFLIDYLVRREQAGTPGRGARLSILKGRAYGDQGFRIEKIRINIGRIKDALDDRHRVIRENDLFFPEQLDELNRSVSRIHAHIDFDPASGDFLLFDDASRSGTNVLRNNRNLPVPAGYGFALRSADKIYFGQVCARFDLGA